MIYLIIVTVIWAMSFGLIKGNLTGLDSHFIAFSRLALSFLFFAFFLRFRPFKLIHIASLLVTGAVQFGFMYIFYIYSYSYLAAWQIALFTIFTPLYVTLMNDVISGKFHPLFLLTAVLSIIGAGVIVYKDINNSNLQIGFSLMQLSNICFAAGQVYYKKIKKGLPKVKDSALLAWMFCGAFILSGLNSIIATDWNELTMNRTHIYTILYLGILASGICFYLWNYGATKVNAGALAVINNLKIPLGVAFSIFIFKEEGDLIKMVMGGSIIVLALYLSTHLSTRKSIN